MVTIVVHRTLKDKIMEQVLEAIYSNGVFTPLETPSLPENQHVRLTISVSTPEEPEEALLAWQQVYAGLSEDDIAEVERMTLDRSGFMS
jgi:predicted DNA-binding antitoxin AbrB/MazE fold protein